MKSDFYPPRKKSSPLAFVAAAYVFLGTLVNDAWRMVVCVCVALVTHVLYAYTPLYMAAFITNVALLYWFGGFKVNIEKRNLV